SAHFAATRPMCGPSVLARKFNLCNELRSHHCHSAHSAHFVTELPLSGGSRKPSVGANYYSRGLCGTAPTRPILARLTHELALSSVAQERRTRQGVPPPCAS